MAWLLGDWVSFPGGAVVGAAEAADKAHRLLLSWLTPVQREDFLELKQFRVMGGDTGRVYVIRDAVNYCTSYNGREFCFQPMGPMPHADRLLGMKLALEHNEAEALRVSNWKGSPPLTLAPLIGSNLVDIRCQLM
jgi:hypothetical protein